MKSRGITLIEVVVAVALVMIIGTALISFAAAAISLSNTSKIRSTATDYADQKVEQVKAAESANRLSIQNGDWSTIIALAGSPETLPLGGQYTTSGSNYNFFTRRVTLSPAAPNKDTTSVSVNIIVSWPDTTTPVGCPPKTDCVNFTTYVSRWKL